MDKSMSEKEREKLVRIIRQSPAGSKVAAANEFGIDLTLLLRQLSMTPTARLQHLAAAQEFVREIRLAKRR
jgi:hypothetical protein